MGKIKRLSICVLVCAWMLAGCGQAKAPETVEENTLWVDKEGLVRLYLVDEFDEKAYFDVPELTRMAMEEAEKHNKEHSSGGSRNAVVVEKVEKSAVDGRIHVNYTFADGKAFSEFEFIDETLFYGTVKEAKDAGYNLGSVALVNAKDGSMTTGAAIESSAAEKHILITDQKAVIYCPYPVTHVGEGAVCREDGTVDTTKAAGDVFILMKN